jgi:hypothetical protein
MSKNFFSEKELELLNEIFQMSEEMVADYYKMSDSDWDKIKYDFKTLKDLKSHEIVDGPFAQVVKYDAKPWKSLFNSSVYTVYRICVQDNVVLDRIKKYRLPVAALFFYIAVHELIHVVRFSKYLKKFEAEGEEMMQEEKKVHDITREILEKTGVSGRTEVVSFFVRHLPY